MHIDQEAIQRQIPFYLTAPQQVGLVKALNQLPHCNYYTTQSIDDVLQGDGWSKLQILNFDDGNRKEVRGIFLSNSCDMAPENKRALSPKITFAPLIAMSKYGDRLLSSGMTQAGVDSKFAEIRKQAVTSIFFLPMGAGLKEDHIVWLEDIHSVPFHYFKQQTEKAKVFTLSQVGFYIFLMKLSIHFCRMHEGVARDEN
jgi:hypothetical protein